MNKKFIFFILGLLAIFDFLTLGKFVPNIIYQVYIFLFLVIIPGLSTLSLLKIKGLISWEKIVLGVGLSIGELMLLGLFLNSILPYFRINDPLSTKYLVLGINILLITIEVINYIFIVKGTSRVRKIPRLPLKIPFSVIIIVVPILSILGSISLNNGYSNLLTIITLILILLSILTGYIFRNKFKLYEFALIIYFISMSLLFMTSLRGWYITGHDIRREFQVFQITNIHQKWDMSNFQDAYNSCLSITILPTIFSNLVKINPNYIYKLLFQVIFALVPVIVFLSLHKISNLFIAFLSAVIFMSFPLFIQDLTMLNRQEIALMFFSLIAFLVTNTQIDIKKRKLLSIFFVICLVVSHYSTSYLTFIVFVFTYIISKIYVLIRKTKLFNLIICKSNFETIHKKSLISLPFVIVFGLSVFFWNNQITKTSDGPKQFFHNVFASINTLSENNINLSDTFLSNLFPKRETADQVFVLEKYKDELDSIYSNAILAIPAHELINDTTKISYETHLPLKPVGQFLNKYNIELFDFNYKYRRIATSTIQIFLILGIIVWLFCKNNAAKNNEVYFVAISLVIIVVSFVLLPNVTVFYGTVRFLQQALIIVSLPILLFVSKIPNYKKDSALLPTIYTISFFIIISGLLPEITGGFTSQLNLNNSGGFYDRYYISMPEIKSNAWLLSTTKPKDIVYSDNTIQLYDPLNSHDLVYRNDFLTTSVTKDSYLYLSRSNLKQQRYSVLYLGETIHYNLDNSLLYKYKNTVYSNGISAILK